MTGFPEHAPLSHLADPLFKVNIIAGQHTQTGGIVGIVESPGYDRPEGFPKPFGSSHAGAAEH